MRLKMAYMCVCALALASLHDLEGRACAQQLVSHERPTIGTWIPSPLQVTSSASSCKSHVVRDGYVSTQVNIDRSGCNIVGDAANEPSVAVPAGYNSGTEVCR